jgi:uncharacterized glyoxalase superfamily protein PhnB
MSEDRSVTSEIEVPVDAGTAFRAFTEDLDRWWVRGPINFFDGARAVAMTCEPGVGGRLLEVYDPASGDALELGRITVWQPGERLAWQSSLDQVQVDVSFGRTLDGTLVRVTATIPAGTQDQGGSAWARVVPPWFGAYCTRLADGTAPDGPRENGRLAIAIAYEKPAAAARWLAEVFGLETPGILGEDGGHQWIEFLAGHCSVIITGQDGMLPGSRPGPPPAEGTAASHTPWIYVDDLDAHFARAQAGGATIVAPIHQHGFRAYAADDLEGHRWVFAQARPAMD